jgi:predicted RNA methylase
MELAIILVALILIIPAVYASIIGAPTLPSTGPHVKKALEKAGVKKGVKFYELGTGTGKVSVMALKMGADIIGYELSPVFFLISFIRLKTTGKSFKLKFKNFLTDDISKADIIYIFLMPRTIENIKKSLFSKISSDAKIISYAFPISGWEENFKIEMINQPPIYIYYRNKQSHYEQ